MGNLPGIGLGSSLVSLMLLKPKRNDHRLKSAWNGRHDNWIVKPRPELSVREQVHAQRRDPTRHRPASARRQFYQAKHQHRKHVLAYLSLGDSRRDAHGSLDLQVLLQLLDKQLNRRVVFINRANSLASAPEIVEQEQNLLSLLRIVETQELKLIRGLFLRLGATGADYVGPADVTFARIRNGRNLYRPVHNVVLLARQEIHSFILSNASAYWATNAAARELTKSLGNERALTGIPASAVTSTTGTSPNRAQLPQSQLDNTHANTTIGRLGEEEEVTALASCLSTEECLFSIAVVFDISSDCVPRTELRSMAESRPSRTTARIPGDTTHGLTLIDTHMCVLAMTCARYSSLTPPQSVAIIRNVNPIARSDLLDEYLCDTTADDVLVPEIRHIEVGADPTVALAYSQAIVAHAKLEKAGAAEPLERHSTYVRGSWQILNWHSVLMRAHTPRDLLADEAWWSGFKCLKRQDLRFDRQIHPAQILAAVRVAQHHPGTCRVFSAWRGSMRTRYPAKRHGETLQIRYARVALERGEPTAVRTADLGDLWHRADHDRQRLPYGLPARGDAAYARILEGLECRGVCQALSRYRRANLPELT